MIASEPWITFGFIDETTVYQYGYVASGREALCSAPVRSGDEVAGHIGETLVIERPAGDVGDLLGWDARLTSELVLLFLYLGYMAPDAAIEDRRTASRATAILALVGVVDLPIIHYSVEWWNTLHQGPTVTKLGAPSVHPSMLAPLLLMALAFTGYYLALVRARCELLVRERGSAWVQEIAAADGGAPHP